MQTAPQSVLITGSNRGLGLAFVQGLLALPTPPKHIIATCRSLEKAVVLKNIAEKNPSVKILQLDVGDFASLPAFERAVASVVGEDGLNLVICNAGVTERKTLDTVTPEAMMDAFKINVVGPLMITKTLLPHLKRTVPSSVNALGCLNSMIVYISSNFGSIAYDAPVQMYDYRSSKAALNMVMKNLSIDLEPQGILTLALHPGWVKTDMGGPDAPIDDTKSIDGMLKVIAQASEKDSGKFYDYQGIPIPW